VVEATRQASAVGGGGYVDTPNQRFAVTHRTPLTGASDLSRMVAAYREARRSRWATSRS